MMIIKGRDKEGCYNNYRNSCLTR
uniref:Uncharacterized protein n=1 Tax=Arundo donax TaxID=35708 RepID=A0A0A8ZHR5_ARUDO